MGIAVWWAIGLGVALRLFPRDRVPGAAVSAGLLLAGYAAWALASIAWAASAEKAFAEFNRATLLLGVFVLAAIAARRRHSAAWVDGLTVAIVGISVVALASRFFPDLFGSRGLAEFLPEWQVRLSFPLGYWNGLAIFVALGIPLLLRRASLGPTLVRGAAVAAIPPVAAVIYLASSRGGAATALVGAVVTIGLSSRRWAGAGALAVGTAGAALSLAVLSRRDELVDGPLDAAVVVGQGRSAAALLVVIGVAAGAVYALLAAALRDVRVPQAPRAAVVAFVAVGVAVLTVTVRPLERFEEFRSPPASGAPRAGGFVEAHLVSANGSGRWQFWTAAVEQWESRPLLGGGAGSYESWWSRRGSLGTFLRDAHSLYAETLGELGLVGVLLVVGVFAVGLWEGLRRALRAEGDERVTLAALVATLAAFAVAVGIDWMWELTAVAAVGLVTLGLLTGTATSPSQLGRRPPALLGTAVVLAAWLVVCAQAVLLFTRVELARSESAASAGDGAAALRHAEAAAALQPWAATPDIQRALVYERLGRLGAARRALAEAARADPENWRIPYSAARLEALAGNGRAAVRQLERARRLNPRSSFLASIGQ